MRISDWSSDVCSSDLDGRSVADLPHTDAQQPSEAQMVELVRRGGAGEQAVRALFVEAGVALAAAVSVVGSVLAPRRIAGERARGRVGKRWSVRVGLVGSLIIKKKKNTNHA